MPFPCCLSIMPAGSSTAGIMDSLDCKRWKATAQQHIAMPTATEQTCILYGSRLSYPVPTLPAPTGRRGAAAAPSSYGIAETVDCSTIHAIITRGWYQQGPCQLTHARQLQHGHASNSSDARLQPTVCTHTPFQQGMIHFIYVGTGGLVCTTAHATWPLYHQQPQA